MKKQEILDIIMKCSTYNTNGGVKYVDHIDYDKLVNTLQEAINYTHSCPELCDECSRENNLQKLTEQAQDLGLGYD